VNLLYELRRHRARHYSQNGEDGVIERLLSIIGVTNRFYVEFGVATGEECNTRWLRQNGWTGLMMDRDCENPDLDLHRELVTAENVVQLFASYHVPRSFDVLSVDIDGNDYWVLKALLPTYRPRLAVVEYNAAIPPEISVTQPYEAEYRWTGQLDTGQSLLALRKVGAANGYSLVYASPPNAYLVDRRLLPPEYSEVSVRRIFDEGLPRLVRFIPFVHWIQRRYWDRSLKHGRWAEV
jgi:hypothetical protein